jgi:hypothetical protein
MLTWPSSGWSEVDTVEHDATPSAPPARDAAQALLGTALTRNHRTAKAD